MKKISVLLLAIGALFASCTQSEPDTIPVSGVILDQTSLTLTEGEKETLIATVSPKEATNKDVLWSTSNKKIAIVEEGVVSAVGAGDAVITVTTDDGGKTANCIVTVNTRVYPVDGVSVSPTSTSITIGETIELSATVSPDNASDKTVSWSSSHSSIASVDNNGVVIAQAVGVATITAKSNSDNSKYAICAVTVEPIHVTSVAVTPTTLTLTEGDKGTVYATISPENATDKSVVWSSDNTNVATVDPSTGEVTAIKSGTAHVEAITKDGGKTASCTVTVNTRTYSVTGIELNKTSLSLRIGSTENLIATISPDNATNKNVTWTCLDPGIASVDNNGLVSAKAIGATVIKVTTTDGGYSASCKVTVEPIPVTSVSLDKTELVLIEGDTEILSATIAPENATNKNITWTSTNPAVATVSNGTVKAVAPGTTMIIVTTEDGGYTATCDITVIVPVAGINLDKTSAEINVGKTVTLTATINPSNATNKNITWASSNSGVATISNGVVKGISAGAATITVKTEDGGYTAECSVSVVVPVSSVSLSKTSLDMIAGKTATLTATINPSNATNKNLRWTSSNPAVATVNDGVVTTLIAGTATITVETEDGGYTATCAVSVTKINSGGNEGFAEEEL